VNLVKKESLVDLKVWSRGLDTVTLGSLGG
jgi:hypothetical protein